MMSLNYRQRFIIIIGFAVLGCILLSKDVRQILTVFSSEHGEIRIDSLNGTKIQDIEFLIHTNGCDIENVDAFSKSILPYISKVEPFRCRDSQNVSFGLVYLKENHLLVNATIRDRVLKHYNRTKADFHCCVEYFKRYSDEKDDKVRRVVGKCTRFTDKLSIEDEFMSIACYVQPSESGAQPVYRNFDFAVLRKKHVEARCHAHEQTERLQGRSCDDRLSVLILGIDSVSRLQTMRQLPRTRQVLRDMGAIEFMGYNRVADNTYPNMGAGLLGGRQSSVLDKECIDKSGFLDNCIWLSDYFEAAGYRTAHVENMNHLGTFTTMKRGFRRDMVDYNGRTFFNAMRGLKPRPDCYRGGVSVSDDEAVFQWALEYQLEFARDPHYGLFWISEFSHDLMNTLQHVDEFLPTILQRLATDGSKALNNTLLVFMSDHGLRFGELLVSEIGRFEINLPTMMLVFPAWFRRKHATTIRTLERNAGSRLTSHFDLHATLRAIASCVGPFTPSGAQVKTVTTNNFTGLSLFDPIPEIRTCKMAGIPEKFCACSKFKVRLSLSDDHAQKLGKLVAEKLNSLTNSQRHLCALFNVSSVRQVKAKLDPGLDSDNEFSVIVSTKPGDALFESIVYYSVSERSFRVDDDVMRLNQYGDTSKCISETDDKHLFPICFCV